MKCPHCDFETDSIVTYTLHLRDEHLVRPRPPVRSQGA